MEARSDTDIVTQFLQSRKIDASVTREEAVLPLKRFWLQLGPKATVKKIQSFSDELGLVMKSRSTIILPDFATGEIKVELMVEDHPVVLFDRLAVSSGFSDFKNLQDKYQIPVLLGTTEVNKPLIVDLAKFPHLLVAGTTGSGKSVFAHCIMQSLLMHSAVNRVKVIPIDPKYVEFSQYEKHPGMFYAEPAVATEPETIEERIVDLTGIMDKRLKLLQKHNCRNLAEYRQKFKAGGTYLVVVIDELADLMKTTGKRFEEQLDRLAAKSRAAGIHIVAATQYPTVDVITGTIKANFDGRVCFRVADAVHSRVVLDSSGAENLYGRGDGFISGGGVGFGKLNRFQGALIAEQRQDGGLLKKAKSFLSKTID
jgi:S-DNA-T family DNA segregation ATPase FtsK/SpoIIIE